MNKEKKKCTFFRNFFFVEIFYMMSRLCMQNFMIISQGVPEISHDIPCGQTDKHTEELF